MSKGASATSTASVQNARKNLAQFLKTLNTVPVQELEKSAKVIKAEEIALVPYDTGKLEHSIYCRVSKDRNRPGIVTGASARSPQGYDYAGIQHENETFQHAPGRQAHFISEPFEKEVANLKERLREEIKYNGSR